MSDCNRRDVLKVATATGLASGLPSFLPTSAQAAPAGWVVGYKTGARALVETLQAEGTLCVFGIPGAQENELWDQMKSCGLPYLLVTHEFSAACMADGAARATGRPGVLCVVPGPGITNALTGLGEARLDSIPLVCLAGDVAQGKKYRPFQVHELPNVKLLEPVCKAVLVVEHVAQIPLLTRQAFQLACCGEPGPVGVVIPYHLLIESHKFQSAPLGPAPLCFDEAGFHQALALLSDCRHQVGIYAGLGCMDHGASLVRVAELLGAPVATSVSGKGVINETHPLAVGWGYGPQATRTAEVAFKKVDTILAIGVKFSEVSTGFYSQPQPRRMIHVDACADNLGRVMKTDVCVHADAGLFLNKLLEHKSQITRPACSDMIHGIQRAKKASAVEQCHNYARCGIDPYLFLLALRRASCPDALLFVDVSLSEHWAAEVFTTFGPRTYFNPADNQAMGWSIPAALGAQRVMPGRQVLTVTGDGCFFMSGLEISTAVRENLPVKFFVLDDQAYHYMQALQKQAYRRTTATVLARLDYPALAKGLGLDCYELTSLEDLEARLRGILSVPGPALVRVACDYGNRPVRWINAVRRRFTRELSPAQAARFAARLAGRSLASHPNND